jgi:signal transduction histidine kinase
MTAVFCLSIAALMMIATSGFIWYARHTAERNADKLLNSAAQELRLEFPDYKKSLDIKKLMEEEREDLRPENISLTVVKDNGQVAGSTEGGARTLPLSKKNGWRTISIRMGRNTVLIGTPWRHVEEELHYHSVVRFFLVTFVTLLAAVGAWVLVGHTLSPIAALSKQASDASTDSLYIHLREPSSDAEIVGLVATLNDLLTRLSETAKAKGRFYSAASHELRTPLQALSGHLELALTRDRSNDEYKQVVEEAYAQTRRLTLLVKNLLLLYRLDSGTAWPALEPGDTASICRQVLIQYRPLMEQRDIRVKTDLQAGILIAAPPMHMDMLVRNLIENAAKYADPGSEIVLGLSANEGKARLQIFNRCPYDPEWDLDRLFEPFGRSDTSRNSKTGGTGLGLAICKAVADSNRWEFGLRQDLDGVRANLVFPCSVDNAS